jgi:hypothetical protein
MDALEATFNFRRCRKSSDDREMLPTSAELIVEPLLIQRPARRDLREAVSWYRERNAEVGDRFTAEIERTLN